MNVAPHCTSRSLIAFGLASFVACGDTQLATQLERLRAPTAGLAKRSAAHFEPLDAGDPEAPFATKTDALEWIAWLADYQPIPKESFQADALILRLAPDDQELLAVVDLHPENGSVVPVIRAFQKLVVSGDALSFTDAEWMSLRDAMIAYTEHSTQGPTSFMTLMVAASVVDLVTKVKTPQLTPTQRDKLALLEENEHLLMATLQAHKLTTSAGFQVETMPIRLACEDLRHQIRVTLSELL